MPLQAGYEIYALLVIDVNSTLCNNTRNKRIESVNS